MEHTTISTAIDEISSIKAQLASRDIESAIRSHKLDKDAAELFREAVSGKVLDAKELDARAGKFARLAPAPIAPNTEGGARNQGLPDAPGGEYPYSFNPPGGVKW